MMKYGSVCFLGAVCIGSSALYAVSETQVNTLEKRVAQLEKKYQDLNDAGFPIGGEIQGDDLTVQFGGDFLWWYAEEGGLAYALETTVNNSYNPLPTEVEHIKWRFQPGFRILFGFNTGHDNWKLTMDWAYFNANAKNSVTVAPITDSIGDVILYNPWSGEFADNAQANFAYARFKVNLNLLNLEMQKPLWFGKYTMIEPHFGIRAARTDTDFTVHNYAQNTDEGTLLDNETQYSQEQKGIGPVFGINGGWYFNKYLSFYTNSGVSLLFTENKVKKVATLTDVVNDSSEYFTAQSKVYMMQPMLDLAVGLKLEMWPVTNRVLFTLALGWEAHSYIGYNVLFKTYNSSNIGLISESNGSLSFQGGVVRAALDF